MAARAPLPLPRTLSMASGLVARLEADEITGDGIILLVDGAEQSHVDVADQRRVFYEYLQRIAHVLASLCPPQPRVLHLGAGAMTLPRALGMTHPGSRHVVVDRERELMDFVLRYVPLPEPLRAARTATLTTALEARMTAGADGADVVPVIADAKDYVEAALRGDGEGFDAIVLDIFTGRDSPEHLADPSFYAMLHRALAAKGTLVVNLGDDEGMHFARAQIRALQAEFGDVLASGESTLFSGRYPGNIIAAATDQPFPPAVVDRLRAAGPHPATVLSGPELDGFARDR
uniref:Spermidine synthase n=1 Tax=Zhihengliuella flava TaxID=1285193 RepID=A0A931D4D5_9MICC|nr:SAM-dependent methyltransferase [Zhihengliuella flava]MBG6083530.1 spermidine synthase [Zhihengliuella flava]